MTLTPLLYTIEMQGSISIGQGRTIYFNSGPLLYTIEIQGYDNFIDKTLDNHNSQVQTMLVSTEDSNKC